MEKRLKERYKYTDIEKVLSGAEGLQSAAAVVAVNARHCLFRPEAAGADVIPPAVKDEPLVRANIGVGKAEGVCLSLPQGARGEGIIEVTADYPSADAGCYTVRNYIKAGRGASARVTIFHNAAGNRNSAMNTITVVEAEEECNIELAEIACSGAVLLSTIAVRQAAGSNVRITTADVDNRILVRNQRIELSGERAECTLGGIYLTGIGELADNYVDMEHFEPHCTSNQLFKGIIGGNSRAAFTGHIFVAQDSQRTAACQQNHNIVMGEEAKVDSRPQLEIYADDVKCSHGATVGKLDPEALYYMRQRGISLEAAKRLQLEGFVEEALMLGGMEDTHAIVRQRVFRKLNTARGCFDGRD